MNSRLAKIITECGYTVADVSRDAGINKSQIFRWISGKAMPDTENLVKLWKLFPHIDLHWLITGEKK